jgi:meiotically up-regulated gene 157 (Mug157) protein
MNSSELLKIVKQYSQKSEDGYGDITVTRVPNQKTVFVEETDGVGRAVLLDRYEVDGATYWAGYSSRSETVYISLTA